MFLLELDFGDVALVFQISELCNDIDIIDRGEYI